MENKEFTVKDRLGLVTVTGALLADQRFGSDRKPRWTDMALYRVVETLDDWRITLSCTGCSPPRTLLTRVDTLGEAPIVCGGCEKQFVPDRSQPDKPFRYALEIIARSYVYHRADGRCAKRRHRYSTVEEVRMSSGRWRNLFQCPVCKPPELEDMRDDERIAEERSDTHVYLCSDADSIIRKLYQRNGEISVMAAKLLREAARNDPNIDLALKTQRKI